MMFNKRYMAILLFLIIGVFAISQVSAADLNATDAIASDVANDEIIGDVANKEVSSDLNNSETAIDVQSDDKAVSNENDDVLTANYGTFTDLNNLISSARVDSSTGYATVRLDRDYAYDDDVDGNFYGGISIGKSVSIIGNDHNIFAHGAKVFKIPSSTNLVIISNLNFINIYDDDMIYGDDDFSFMTRGGAIENYGNLLMTSCGFALNFAKYGGAIYSGENSLLYLKSCYFLNNTASFEGGAVCNYGITMVTGETGDYTVFTNNTARYGGAISTNNELYVDNSGFIGNYAFATGGAIYNELGNISHIDDSGFYDNYAGNVAGAIYNSIVLNSEFDDANFADGDYGGHSMYKGVRINCICEDEIQTDFVNVIVSTGFSFESTTTAPYIQGSKGQAFQVLVTSNPNKEKIKGVKVRLSIDGGKYNYTAVTDENGLATFTLPELTDGTHSFTTSLDYSSFNNRETTDKIMVGKYDSPIEFDKDRIIYSYGDSGTTTVKITGGTVRSASIVGHPDVIPNINGNKITITGLNPGSYTLNVDINPDDTHKSNMSSIGVTVNKRNAKIIVKAMTTYYNSGKKWTVSLRDTTSNRPLQYVKLTLRVYTGSSYRNYYATTNANGVATFAAASKLNPGNHKVVVSYSNAKYNCPAATTYIKVNKMTFSYVVTSRQYDDGSRIDVQVRDKASNKPINGVKIKLVIYTGSRISKTVVLTTANFDGKFAWIAYATNMLTAGSHLVKIMPYDTSKYMGTRNAQLYIKAIATKKKKSYMMITNGRQIVR